MWRDKHVHCHPISSTVLDWMFLACQRAFLLPLDPDYNQLRKRYAVLNRRNTTVCYRCFFYWHLSVDLTQLLLSTRTKNDFLFVYLNISSLFCIFELVLLSNLYIAGFILTCTQKCCYGCLVIRRYSLDIESYENCSLFFYLFSTFTLFFM